MYSFAEVLPFLYNHYYSNPSLKNELFINDHDYYEQLTQQLYELTNEPVKFIYTVHIKSFTSSNEEGETRSFEERIFQLNVSKTKYEEPQQLDINKDYKYNKELHYHYITTFEDVDTGDKFLMKTYFLRGSNNSTFDYIQLEALQKKKTKKNNIDIKSSFVLIEVYSNLDNHFIKKDKSYHILGIFGSLDTTIKACQENGLNNHFNKNYHIEEIPFNTFLMNNKEQNTINYIEGAFNLYSISGEIINTLEYDFYY